jgi:hypothetical protein
VYQQLKRSLKNQKMSQNKTNINEEKDIREIEVINIEEVSDKFEVEDVYGNVTIYNTNEIKK